MMRPTALILGRSEKMSKLFWKNLIFSFCIGIAVAIIYDGFKPEYNYYDQQGGTRISYEVYKELANKKGNDDYSRKKLVKYKQLNIYAFLLGAAAAIATLTIQPIKMKSPTLDRGTQ